MQFFDEGVIFFLHVRRIIAQQISVSLGSLVGTNKGGPHCPSGNHGHLRTRMQMISMLDACQRQSTKLLVESTKLAGLQMSTLVPSASSYKDKHPFGIFHIRKHLFSPREA